MQLNVIWRADGDDFMTEGLATSGEVLLINPNSADLIIESGPSEPIRQRSLIRYVTP